MGWAFVISIKIVIPFTFSQESDEMYRMVNKYVLYITVYHFERRNIK